ncbi:unnamed protein product [Arabidopsis thaliana]|uniref:Uncharacterized protein n=1 Tax=Arabidopsis thaliana TaxID=3702 RepID=Q9LHD7_ARATH|nr:unnamed protein product [Arabidopsis thaliana]
MGVTFVAWKRQTPKNSEDLRNPTINRKLYTRLTDMMTHIRNGALTAYNWGGERMQHRRSSHQLTTTNISSSITLGLMATSREQLVSFCIVSSHSGRKPLVEGETFMHELWVRFGPSEGEIFHEALSKFVKQGAHDYSY